MNAFLRRRSASTTRKGGSMGEIEIYKEKEKALETKSKDYLARCKAFKITDHEHYGVADTARINGKDHIKIIEELLDPHIARAFETHRGLTGDKKRLIEPVKQGRKLIGEKMEVWDAEIRKKAQEEEAKLRKRAQEEAEKEEAKRLREEAKELKKEGDTAGAEALREEAKNPVVDPVSINESLLPSTPETKTKYRNDWSIEVIGKKYVPFEYLEVNEAMILKMVRATKGKVAVPGVQITPKRIPI